jgi:hypothetical protein
MTHRTEGVHRFKLWPLEQMRRLPPIEWLIGGVFEAHSFCLLYGAPANYKSFLALDWGLCIATGRASWNGRPVRAGPVIYIAGEGDRGIQKRADAWLRHHAVEDAPDFYVVRQAVQLRHGVDVPELIGQIDALNVKPVLIIIDTLNRAFVGGDENSAKDMGEFLKGVAQLQQLGAAVLVLHHTIKGGQDARGSGSLHGAADTMIFVERTGDLVTVENKKMKDEAEFAEMTFETKVVEIGGGSSSLVLVPFDPVGAAMAIDAALVGSSVKPALETLRLASEPLQLQDWVEMHGARIGKQVSKDTFGKWRRKLQDDGLIEATPAHPPRYFVTEKGADAIGVPLARQSDSHTPAMPPPLGGGVAERETSGPEA